MVDRAGSVRVTAHIRCNGNRTQSRRKLRHTGERYASDVGCTELLEILLGRSALLLGRPAGALALVLRLLYNVAYIGRTVDTIINDSGYPHPKHHWSCYAALEFGAAGPPEVVLC